MTTTNIYLFMYSPLLLMAVTSESRDLTMRSCVRRLECRVRGSSCNDQRSNRIKCVNTIKTVFGKTVLFFSVVIPRGLVDRWQRFGGTYCLHLQGCLPKYGYRVKMETLCLSEKFASPCGSSRHYTSQQQWRLRRGERERTSNHAVGGKWVVIRLKIVFKVFRSVRAQDFMSG
jgi:hypothetical protein